MEFEKRRLDKAEIDTYKAIIKDKEIRRSTTKMLYQLVEEEALLRQIKQALETNFNLIPALIIYGEKDPLTKLEVPQRIHQLLPNSAFAFHQM